MIYEIYLGRELMCRTEWAPMAQTAWHRVSRDPAAVKQGAGITLLRDGALIASETPLALKGRPWPDASTPESDWHDVMRQLVLLFRDDGMSASDIAAAMTEAGLPTSRSRIDALRGTKPRKRAEVCPAELVTLLGAVIHRRVKEDGSE